MMTMKVALMLSMLVMEGWGYSGGPPRCNLKSPSHPGKTKDLAAAEAAGFEVAVSKGRGDNWKVTVTGNFKGLLINAKNSGDWSVEDNSNFQIKANQGNCVTHKNSSDKSGATFFFNSSSKPQLCVIIVEKYSKHYYFCL